MAKVGKILWWDRRDQEGIIVDGLGNQFYFNRSVATASSLNKFSDGQLVEFEVATHISYVSCATGVCVVTSRSKKQAERKFYEERQLTLGGL